MSTPLLKSSSPVRVQPSPPPGAGDSFLNRNGSVLAIVIKIAVLGVVLALAIYAIPLLIHYQMWMWLVVMSLATVSLFVIYTTKHFIPAKYLYPGSVFLCIFLVIPIILTVQYSMTNFGDGARGSKAETIESIVANSIKPSADSPFYNLAVAVESAGMVDSGPYTLFLTATGVTDPPVLFGVDGGEVATWTGEPATVTDGQVTGVPGYVLLTRPQINQQMAQISAIAVKVPGDDQAGIRIQGFQAYEGSASISYDAQQDALIDHATNPATVYPNQKIGDAYCFVDQAKGQCFQAQSWLQNVGAANYQRLLGDSGVRNQFLAAFGWTLIFAFGNVLICFLAGFLLAVTLNDDRIKGKKLWRSFLLLPYAVPALISLLMWSQFFNRDFGLVNRIFGANLDWLGDPTLAKVAIFIVQLWMGFPYMFIVCTGALQSIPSDVKEAARIDGASGIATTFRIILPLLLIAVAPLLVSSFAFNFNNFNAIKLLTDGGPSIPGQFLRGSTDILISMVYKRAFGGSGTELGFASAMSVLLFIITGVLAAAQFRLTKRLETIA